MVFSVCNVYFVVLFRVFKLVCPDSTLEYSRSTSLLTVIHPASARDIADCSHSLESFIKNIRSPNVISEYIFMVPAKVIQRADFCKTHYPLVNGKSSTFFRVR